MHEQSPYFHFYPMEFLNDDAVVGLELDEVGAYAVLLFRSWHEPLPNDPARLARILKVSRREFARLWKKIGPCFTTNGHGRLINERLERERARLHAWKQSRATNGAKGAAKRWDH